MTGEQRTTWQAFLHHEGIAWSATILWLLSITALVLWKGAPYDPNKALDLKDWADLGTFLSAVVAPIAVLWVVRSFYVQKRELASAVAAAAEQAKSASHQAAAIIDQNKMMQEDREALVTPSIQLAMSGSLREIDPDATYMLDIEEGLQAGSEEEYLFRTKNVGAGSAYDLLLLLEGVRSDRLNRWATTIDVESVFRSDQTKDLQYRHVIPVNTPPTEFLFVTVQCKNRQKKAFMQRFLYEISSRALSELTEDKYAQEHRRFVRTLEDAR